MPFLLPLAATAAAAAAPAAAAATAAAAPSLSATLVSVASQAAVSMAINAAMSVLSPKVGAAGRPVDWTLNPDGPIPFAFGRVGAAGAVIHKRTFGPDKMYYGFVSVLSGAGPIDGFEGFTADDFPVTFAGAGIAVSSEWTGEMWRVTRLGNQPETWLPTPAGLKHNATLPNWTSSHRASGKAQSMLVMGENSKRTAYPNGEVKPLEVFRGLKCWDPRLDSTYPGGSGACRLDNPSTWVWSENPFICALKWCLGLWEDPVGKGVPQIGQQVGGIGSKLAGIDVPAFLAAANVADANGWICAAYPNTDDDKNQVLVSFFQAGGAIYAQRAGKISLIQRAAPRTSVATITADDVIGAIEVDTAASRIDRINTIQPTYWSPQHRWQMTALPEVTAQAFRDADGGKRSRGVTYPYVTNANQAAQLAALDIANARESMAGQVALKPHLQRIQPGDVFLISEPGFLLDGVKCLCMNTEYDPAEAVVRVTFISETDAKYPFALGQSTVPPVPPTLTSPNEPVSPPLPEDWTVVIRPPAIGGGQVPGFDLEGVVSNDTATAILVEWAPTADGPWTQAYSGPPTTTTIPVIGVQPSQTYFIAVSYIRNQNTSTRQVYGPYVAPGLIADDVMPTGPNVVQFLDDIAAERDAALAAAGAAMADAQASLQQTLEDADDALRDADTAFNSRLLAFGIASNGAFHSSGTLITDLNGRATVAQLNIQVSRIDGHGSLIGGLTSTVNDLPNNYTSASTFQTLQSEIAAARGSGNPSLSARLQQVQQTITDGLAGKASVSEITRLDGRVDSANGRIDGAVTRLDQVDLDIDGVSGAVSGVSLEVVNARGGTASLNQRLNTVETNVNGKASATRVDALESKVDTPTTGLLAVVGQLQTTSAGLETGKADASRVSVIEANAARDPAINAAPNFGSAAWSNGTIPTGWYALTNAAMTARVVGKVGPHALRLTAPAATPVAVGSDTPTNFPTPTAANGWWVLEVTAERASGSLIHTEVDLSVWSAGYTTLRRATTIGLGAHPDEQGVIDPTPTALKLVKWATLFEITGALSTDRWVFSVRNGNPRYSPGPTVACAVNFHRIAVRPATPTEVEMRQARGVATSVGARITAEETATADLYGRTRARWAINASVPGADAFIEARAETVAGQPPTSNVAIGARQVAIYNPTGDDWKKALEVVGGNVLLSGGLQAGTFIRLGNGAGWPVALRSVDFTATDGEVINFGTDLGSLPALSFSMNNLAPLTPGETYDVKATNLTATGFTLSAKINVPAAPSSQTTTGSPAAVTISSKPGLYRSIAGISYSVDGTFNISASGTQQHRVFPNSSGQQQADNESYVTTHVGVYALKAGVWQLVSTLYAESMVDPDNTFGDHPVTVTQAWTVSQTVQVGTGATQIAAVVAGSSNTLPASLTSFGQITWTSQGAGSGTRSATPAGEKTRITVRPQ